MGDGVQSSMTPRRIAYEKVLQYGLTRVLTSVFQLESCSAKSLKDAMRIILPRCRLHELLCGLAVTLTRIVELADIIHIDKTMVESQFLSLMRNSVKDVCEGLEHTWIVCGLRPIRPSVEQNAWLFKIQTQGITTVILHPFKYQRGNVLYCHCALDPATSSLIGSISTTQTLAQKWSVRRSTLVQLD